MAKRFATPLSKFAKPPTKSIMRDLKLLQLCVRDVHEGDAEFVRSRMYRAAKTLGIKVRTSKKKSPYGPAYARVEAIVKGGRYDN